MTPAPLQLGQAPSELALNSAGLTPLAFANALRIGSSSPVYVAGLLRRETPIAPWWIDTTSVPVGVRTVVLSAARSSRWRPVRVPLARSLLTVPSKQTFPPAVPAPGPR